MTDDPETCFHCGLPVPAQSSWRAEVLDAERSFCCPGCQEVCRAIVAAGIEDYYRYRTANPGRADPDAVPELLRRLTLYDHPDVQKSFVRDRGSAREASLILEGIRCAACVWLNERHLRSLDGVLDVQMDYASQRAQVTWDPQKIRLSDILKAVADIGYVAHPYDPAHRERLLRERRHRDARRLIFAGAIGMPVMQFSLATYFMGASVTGHLELWEVIGRWSTLLAVTAVLSYAAQDFFVGAWRDFRARRLGMDVPIVIGLATAWLGSAAATVRHAGEVYVDSIAMFVFFVLLARVFEIRGRVTAADAMDRLARVAPRSARRLGADGAEQEVAAVDLLPGDVLRVYVGEYLAVDGIIREGRSTFDESALTGEALPVSRGPGERVIAGTCNREQTVLVEVTRVGDASTAGEIRHLLDQALRGRPRYAVLAERAAQWFVAAVLAVAALTVALWLWLDPAQVLPNTIAVLIVTCPCALALATPVALAASAGRFVDLGALPLNMGALESLARADTAAFDKTGTLTLGHLEVASVHLTGRLDRDGVLALAAALETGSEHPVGRALRRLAPRHGAPAVVQRHNEPGAGVCGTVDGVRWHLGRPGFVTGGAPLEAPVAQRLDELARSGLLSVLLGDGARVHAVLGLRDAQREGAAALTAALRAQGIGRLAILSGDGHYNVRQMAAALDIEEASGELSPADKLAWIRARQAEGRRVMMVGDGLNDAPTLAAADVSVSFADATDLAQLHSDFILLATDLHVIGGARRLARRTVRVIRQNLIWAAAYNLLAVPAAFLGLVPPWAAAIGMSVSSLVVVGNALRVGRRPSGWVSRLRSARVAPRIAPLTSG